jgi:hypothetical protein
VVELESGAVLASYLSPYAATHQHTEHLISLITGIAPERLLRWTAAWAGLSAASHRMPYLTGRPADVVRVDLLAERALDAWS